MPSDYSAQVLGFPPPPPPAPMDLPPGAGAYAVPHPFGFAALYNQGFEIYRWSFDEALRHSVTNMLAMRRDPVIMSALETRQRPTALLSWHIDPSDETHPDEAEAAQRCTKLIERFPDFQWFRVQLLEALWYGHSGAQVRFDWRFPRGEKTLHPNDWIPVNGDKIRFAWDDRVGLTVHATYPGDKEASDFNFVHYLTPAERQQFVLHRHKPEDADWREGEFAAQIKGVGIRSRLYWWWWLKQQFLGMLSNYIQRFANGLTIITYDAHNKEAKQWADEAARTPWSQAAFKIPQWDAVKPNVNSVNRLEVGTANPQLLEKLITDYFDSKIKEYILGQNLTTETAPTGLGSGVADAHQETMANVIKFDAQTLEQSIQRDFIDVLYHWNYAGLQGGRFSFEVDSPNAEEYLNNAQIAYQLGMALDEEQIREITKLAKPKPGKPILSPVQAMQPAAVPAPGPDAVPQVGPAGPAGAMSGAVPSSMAAGAQPVSAGQMLAFNRRFRPEDVRRLARKQLSPRMRNRIRNAVRRINAKKQDWPPVPKGWRWSPAAYWVAAASI